MVWDRTNHPAWPRYAVGVLLAILAAAVRWQFLEVLEFRVTFLTFYPAVALAALYGGFYPGLAATAVSVVLARYLWIEPVGRFAITNIADVLILVIFVCSGTLISYLAEAMYRAQARAHEAEEKSMLAAQREKAAVALRDSESKYRELVRNANSAIIRWKRDGTIAFFNEYAQKFFGYSAEEVIGRKINILVPERESTGGSLAGLVQNLVNNPEKYVNNINENILRDGGRVWMAWTNRPIFDRDGQLLEILAVGIDITERKRMELESEVTVELLELINNSTATSDLVRAAATFFQKRSGCEAVGIRLREGADFPYFEARGFPEEFILPGNGLCAGDAAGDPTIECMCGNVIRGRFDASLPFFTAKGSFWTNSTTELLAGATGAGRRFVTPNRCNGKGYESVALMPLHIGTDRLGLIHMHDRRKDMIGPGAIALWERLAGYLAIALSKFRTEEQLREQREQLQVTLASVGDAVIATDAQGRVSFINPVAASLTCWPLEEALKRPVQEVFPTIDEQTGEPAEDVVSRVLRDGRPAALANHTALVTRDGREIPVEESAAPIRDTSGNVAGVVLVFHDVTQRRRAQEELRESEELFRGMANAIPQLAWIAGADGYLYWYNRRWYEYTGSTPEQMEGWGWQSVHDPLALPGVLARWKNSIATGNPFEMIFPLRGADGNFRQFLTRVRPVKNPNGEVVQWCGTNTDITERKMMEDDLRRSESEFKLLSETAGNLLASENPRGIVNELCRNVMAHLDCHAFFNYIVEESVGKLRLNAFAGIPEEEAARIEWLDFGVAVCGCVAHDGDRIVAEDIFHTADTRTDLVRSFGIQAYACHPLKIGGKVIGTLSFGTKSRAVFAPRELAVMKTVADQVAVAMERIRLIEGLRKSRDELELRVEERTAALKTYMAKLEESNRALQDFASIASHDLQEPLRKVTTFGNMLKQGCGDALGEQCRDYLERVLNANKRMQSLLAALLEYSRLTTMAEPFVQVELSRIVHDVLSDLEVRVENTGGKVDVGDLPVIEADPTQMRQLFQNLIGNALKFHKDGEKPVVTLRSFMDGNMYRITVADNGIGFEEQYLENIFAPFLRLHGRSSRYEGTGMGLAICKKIVERHGGSVTAGSRPGRGSTFIITLPAKQIAHMS